MKNCEKRMGFAVKELQQAIDDYSFVLSCQDSHEDLENFDSHGEDLKGLVKQITKIVKRTIKQRKATGKVFD